MSSNEPDQPSQSDEALEIVVSTSRGSETFSFAKTTSIEDVIQSVQQHFELSGEASLIPEDGPQEPLEPTDRPLVSFSIEDGDEFILTDEDRNV